MLYFDTSFLVPYFLEEPTSDKVEKFLLRRRTEAIAISHWSRVEFSSVIAREVRMGGLRPRVALDVDAQFEIVMEAGFLILSPTAADFTLSKELLRHFKSGLRAGDALHLAIASNNNASAIYTLDHTMLKAGKRLRLPVRRGIRSP